MKIVVPLKDDENLKITSKHEIIEIRNKNCLYPFGNIFFAEIGKYLTFKRFQLFNDLLHTNEDVALVQNKRCFDEIDNLHIDNNNDVILVNKEDVGNIETQFKSSHGAAANIFDAFKIALNLSNDETTLRYMCPHNMIIAKPIIINTYLSFLENLIMPFYKENFNNKYAAFLGERALYLFCLKMKYNIIEKPFKLI